MPKILKRILCPPPAGLRLSCIPDHQEIRMDYGFREGNLVEPWYDPMIAKVIVREQTGKMPGIS